jgi:hypothetical protein
MAFNFDTLSSSHHLIHGLGFPITVMGTGPTAVRGSSYIEGPSVFGAPIFPNTWASVMIGPMINPDSPPPFIPGGFCYGPPANPFSLATIGSAGILGDLNVATNVIVGANLFTQGLVIGSCGRDILQLKKDFDIPHPTKEGWRLTHACVEGPEAAVYYRGNLVGNNEIHLPEYWTKLVDSDSITVNITPKKYHQNIIVTKIDNNVIYLSEENDLDINCYYLVYAERIDTEKLIVEYEGEIEDYPGDNRQRSIAGYNYDIKN